MTFVTILLIGGSSPYMRFAGNLRVEWDWDYSNVVPLLLLIITISDIRRFVGDSISIYLSIVMIDCIRYPL